MCRMADLVSDGYCTTATWRVSCTSSLTVRATTLSRLYAPARNVSIARRSAPDSGLTLDSRSTKSRYPLSVGIRPALVCGCAMKPCSSSTAMSFLMVAGDTSKW